MASIRIYQDQENSQAQQLRHKQVHGNVGPQKRAVLGEIDNNRKERLPALKGKKPLAVKDNKLNNGIENAKIRTNQQNQRNFVVPVAQFEAFKVYEDCKNEEKPHEKVAEKRHAEPEKVSLPPQEEKMAESPQQEDVIPSSPQNMSVQSIKSSNSYIEIDSPVLAERVLKERCNKNQFFEIEEYRSEIYMYLREHEMKHRPKPSYMKKQPDINQNMRTILVDWLVEVAEEYKLHSETLYLAVNFIDRFLSYMSVVRAKLQLVGTAAMFIAAKYEEIYPPDVGEFVYITDDTYNKRQVIRMEHLILKVLGFDLSIPTPLTFITAICIQNKVSEKALYLAQYISELALLEADPFLEFLSSMIASSAIALANFTLGHEAWGKDMVQSTGYELKHLKVCIEHLHDLFVRAPNLPQHAIQDKYKNLKYLHVSKMEPRNINSLFD